MVMSLPRIRKKILIQNRNMFMIQYLYVRVCSMKLTCGVVQLFGISEMEQGGV
jgi:hypothetical protein